MERADLRKTELEKRFSVERYDLVMGRIHGIKRDKTVKEPYRDYFISVSEFIAKLDAFKRDLDYGFLSKCQVDQLKMVNHKLYEDVLPENYEKSYANPTYAVACLGEKFGKTLCYLYAEIRNMVPFLFQNRMYECMILAELFVEIYNLFEEDNISEKSVQEAIYYFNFDYCEELFSYRTAQTVLPEYDFATQIILDSDLNSPEYLYSYGEYISENELKMVSYFCKQSQERIDEIASVYVNGYIKGFELAGIDLSKKKTVNIRYSIGQERIVKSAIELFKKQGLSPVIFDEAKMRMNKKGAYRVGYISSSPNKQYDYDHRQDEALFLDKAFLERKLEVLKQTYELIKEEALYYGGPACMETFGEEPFLPVEKEEILKLSDKQKNMKLNYQTDAGIVTNNYIKRDAYSFTIIAFPTPEIGDKFEELFDATYEINTLDTEKYCEIQEALIEELNRAEYVIVKGANGNKTDMKVYMHELKDPQKETNFENCLADVNIPLGEVFTSPKLTGTCGTLHVSNAFLNELNFVDFELKFEDGMIIDYNCKNFEEELDNKNYIKDNVMFGFDSLPIGEFAIGTNTTAYKVAREYDILYKLPILIVEKMGPHFAVGDTCYSHSEENRVYNPDGKEIVAKDNECSLLRDVSMEKAYFNCHTDITIPYLELDKIVSVHGDGTKVDIIDGGRFVLPKTEELNIPLSMIKEGC